VNGRWCSAAWKLTTVLAESSDSLLPGLWINELWADCLETGIGSDTGTYTRYESLVLSCLQSSLFRQLTPWHMGVQSLFYVRLVRLIAIYSTKYHISSIWHIVRQASNVINRCCRSDAMQATQQTATVGIVQHGRDAFLGCVMFARSTRQNAGWRWCHLQLRLHISQHRLGMHISVWV